MAAISIVVPVYNTPEEYFRACMASVLAQHFADYEVILVDDGSTTGIGAVCDEYAAKDPRFCVIHQENKGVSAARNAGINKARGEWLLFLDGDDWWEENILEALYAKAKETSVDLLLFGLLFEYPEHQVVQRYFPQKDFGGFTPVSAELAGEMQRGLLDLSNRKIPGCSGEMVRQMIRKTVFIENELRFDENLHMGEDLCFNLELWEKTQKIGIWDRPFYHYRQQLDSASHRYDPNALKYHDATSKKIWQLLCKYQKDESFFAAYAVRLQAAYYASMEQVTNHPANPHTFWERRADWVRWPDTYETFGQFRDLKRSWRKPQKKLFALAAFRLRSLALTNALLRFNRWLHREKNA